MGTGEIQAVVLAAGKGSREAIIERYEFCTQHCVLNFIAITLKERAGRDIVGTGIGFWWLLVVLLLTSQKNCI